MSVIWEIDDADDGIEGVDEFGRPDPAYAAALGLLPAPRGRRVVAAMIDWLGYGLLQLPFWIGAAWLVVLLATASISTVEFLNHPRFVLALVFTSVTVGLTIVYCIVQVSMHGAKGLTIGRGITGLRSVNVATLEKPRFGRSVLRGLVLAASLLVPLLPLALFLSPLWDKERRGRGWLDKVSRMWCVDVRHGLDPYDKKRMRIARKTVVADPVAQAKPMPSLATPLVDGEPVAYRPGARVSAGVLGVASPRSEQAPASVGLSGQQDVVAPAAAPGSPVMGGYRRSAPAPVEQTPYRPGSLQTPPASAPAQRQAREPAARQHAAPAQPQPSAPAQPQPSGAARTQPPQPHAPSSSQAPIASVPAQSAPPSAPPQPPAAVPVDTIFDEPGEATVAGSWDDEEADDLEMTRARAPQRSAPSIVLVLDTGARLEVPSLVLLGRNPTTREGERAHVVPVPDSTRSVSKTHLAVQPDGDGIAVTDRHSTNGTFVQHDGVEQQLPAGGTVHASPGDIVRFGDRTVLVTTA